MIPSIDSRARSVQTLVLVVALASLSCVERPSDSFTVLPRTIGGEPLMYDVLRGSAAHEWAKGALGATRWPETALSSATGFTAPGPNEYQSYVLQVEGASGQDLVEPVLRALGYSAETSWSEQVGSKSTIRVVPVGIDDRSVADYVYAFEDTVVVIHARRAADAEEALRGLP